MLWWVLLFAAIAVGGVLVLGRIALGVWRSARGLLEEVDVLAVRADELAGLLAQVGSGDAAGTGWRTMGDVGSELASNDGWPGTVESYDDRGVTAPGKKEP